MRIRDIFQHEKGNIRFDEELGFTVRPDLKVYFNTEEFRTLVTTNSMGFRDDEASMKDPAILILGDSLAFGWGVEDDEVCEKALEEMSGLKVLNMSVPGYGTFQEFLLLRRWEKTHDISGKTVLFLLYPNDLLDNLGMTPSDPSFRLEEGSIKYLKPEKVALEYKLREYENDPYRRPICKESHLAYRLQRIIPNIRRKILNLPKKKTTHPSFVKRASTIDHNDKFDIFRTVIGWIKDFAEDENFKVAFVWIPTIKYYEKGAAIFGGESETALLSKTKEILRESGLPLIDLTKTLLRADYYKYDGHLKPGGQYKIAAEIYNYLSK